MTETILVGAIAAVCLSWILNDWADRYRLK